MIFNRVIRPSLERFCNLRPSVPVLGVRDDKLSILLDAPLFAFNLRIEMIVPSLATLLSDSPRSSSAILDHRFGPSAVTSLMIRASSSGVHGPLTSSGLSTFCHRCRHCTSVRLSLKYTATRRRKIKTARVSHRLPHHRASIETPYARTPSLSLILSLSLPRVHLARFQNITKKKRTNLLPILPSVHLHRLTQQLILHAANERLSVTPQHSRTNHASRNQSITRSLDRSTRASPPPPSPPVPPRLLRAVSRNLKISNAHLLGRPSTLGALPRRSPDLPVRERARGRRRRRPIYGRRVRSRARAGVSPALPRRPAAAASLRRRRALFVTTVTLGVRDIARANARRYRSSRRRSSSTARHDDARARRSSSRRSSSRRDDDFKFQCKCRVDECRRAGGD